MSYEVDHELSDDDENVHHVWDNIVEPLVTVEPGEVVRFECRDALDGQVGPDSDADDMANASFDPVHPLTGPVAVEGAEPGDVIAVELLDFEHKGWGSRATCPARWASASSRRSSRRPGCISGNWMTTWVTS